MCIHDNANKTLVCTVGELDPGARYRNPDGNEWLVAENFLLVRLDNGTTNSTLDWIGTGYRKDVKLGRDRKGRLYASRFLNPVAVANDPLGFLSPEAQAAIGQ